MQPRRVEFKEVSGGRESVRALEGGRVSVDSTVTNGFTLAVQSPRSFDSDWQFLNIDSELISRASPTYLMEVMSDMSPELSAGLWAWVRLVNPGYEIHVTEPGSDAESAAGKAAIDAFIGGLHGIYTPSVRPGLGTILNTMILGALLRGAFVAELVLDENGRLPLNIATPDPFSVRFKPRRVEGVGILHEPGQYQDGRWASIARETVVYNPIDPLPGSPYGRPVVAASLNIAISLIMILYDLRRVIAQQGWPRIDIEVKLESIMKAFPTVASDPEKFNEYVSALVTEISSVYSDLEPDEAYIHTDDIQVNAPKGALAGAGVSGMGGINTIIEGLERIAARSMKLMPLLLGVQSSTTETNAIRQWQIQMASVSSIQELLKDTVTKLLKLALECQGIRADVVFEFKPLGHGDAFKEAQTEQMQIANAKAKYDAGWISQDEASIEVTGTPADDEPRGEGMEPDEPESAGSADRQQAYAAIVGAQEAIERALMHGNG